MYLIILNNLRPVPTNTSLQGLPFRIHFWCFWAGRGSCGRGRSRLLHRLRESGPFFFSHGKFALHDILYWACPRRHRSRIDPFDSGRVPPSSHGIDPWYNGAPHNTRIRTVFLTSGSNCMDHDTLPNRQIESDPALFYLLLCIWWWDRRWWRRRMHHFFPDTTFQDPTGSLNKRGLIRDKAGC